MGQDSIGKETVRTTTTTTTRTREEEVVNEDVVGETTNKQSKRC